MVKNIKLTQKSKTLDHQISDSPISSPNAASSTRPAGRSFVAESQDSCSPPLSPFAGQLQHRRPSRPLQSPVAVAAPFALHSIVAGRTSEVAPIAVTAKGMRFAGLHFTCYLNRKRSNNLKEMVASSLTCHCKRHSSYSASPLENFHPILQSSGLQNRFKNWQHLRKGKLMASTFSQAIGFWPRRRVQLWLEKIGAIEPFSGNLATCWSNIKEEEALKRYMLITGNPVSMHGFQVHHNMNPEDGWLAASPDGVIDTYVHGLPSRGVLEIKCPFFGGDMTKAWPCSRIPLYYIPQAQGLMEILDRDWMDLYIWTTKGSSLFRLHRDKEYWLALQIALSDFWWKHVQPAKELYNCSEITNPLVELWSLMPEHRHELCSYLVHESNRVVVNNSKLLVREIHGKIQM